MLAVEFWDQSSRILAHLTGPQPDHQFKYPVARINGTAWVEDIPRPNTVMLAVLLGKTVAGGNRAFVLSAQETENSGRRFIRSRVGPDRTAYDAEAGMYTLRKVPVLTGRPRADIDRPPVESVELSLAVPKSDTSSYMGKYVLNTKVSLYIDGDWH